MIKNYNFYISDVDTLAIKYDYGKNRAYSWY
jgi:hypothetical protein